MSNERETKNICFIKGAKYPLQTYGWSGLQLGASLEEVNGKKPTDAAPMSITSQPPGAFADNDNNWITTFGASHDCVLGLFSGKKFNEEIYFMDLQKNSVYRKSIGNADFHIYDIVENVQQLDFVVALDSANDAIDRGATNFDSPEEVRSISMRVPMMAVGWGRTIGMRPTDPDPVDKRDNDNEHKLARETWHHGPVDVRWDDKRKCWGAWNDMITDHRGEGLGTLIFDTNPDPTCGFPFFKGTFEDWCKIVKTGEETGDGSSSDGEKSGTTATHLEHRWTQRTGNNWNSVRMSSIFKIHREPSAKGTCGDESFFECPGIEILTSTFFHLSDTIHGPVCFSASPPDDKDLVGCMKFDGSQFVPAVAFDACSRVGFELNVLFQNDKILADKIIEVCKMTLECLGKSKGKIDPTKTGKAAQSSAAAAAANTAAETALDAIPAGSGPGGEFVAGDELSNAPGAKPLTAGEAKAINDSLPAASEAHQNAAAKQQQAAIDTAAAGEAQAAADTASDSLGAANAEAINSQAAADAANSAVAESPNDPSTKQAAEAANSANSDAQTAKNDAVKNFNDANDAADTAKATADGSHTDAVDASAEAKTKGEQLKDDANGKLPKNVQDAIDAADEANDKANADRENSGIDRDDEDKEPTVDEKIDAAKKELSDKIDGVACEKIEDLISIGDSVGQMVQKALLDMSDAVNNANDANMAAINEALGSTVGYDSETGTGGIETTPVVTPPVCPIEPVGSGKIVPGVPQEGEDEGTQEPPSDGAGGTSTGRKDPAGGSLEPAPPGQGGPTQFGPVGDRPGTIVPPPVPQCPVITIKDPCGGFSTHGPCPGGKGSGTPGGTIAPGTGGPGTPGGANQGGADGDGQVFKT